MASFYITLVNTSGNWSVIARRNGTAATGGTPLSIPWVQSSMSGTGDTNTQMLEVAIRAAQRAIVNDLSATGLGTQSYRINLVEGPVGVWTPAARRDGTAASGGTVLSIPWLANNHNAPPITEDRDINVALIAGARAVLNEQSVNP